MKLVSIGAAAAALAAGCSSGSGGSDGSSSNDPFGDPGDCTVIDVAVSSEKIDLMTDLAQQFNRSEDAEISGGCAFVRPYSKASGGATTALAEGWDEASEGPRPVIWSPAASSWGQILDQQLADAGKPAMASPKPVSFMLTPLVIGMPKPMADALGYPTTPIGWADIAQLATSGEGWAKYGHPEWGAFKLGKTNPNFSTSGLNALIGQNYAATGKTRDLSKEDLDAQRTKDLGRQVESSVVHYGDITMTFLNNWFRTDRSGTSLLYASAVAVEEKSLIDYNQGNPDGVLDPGETPRKPKVPLVAIYPKEGTLYSDSPLYVLDADWVSAQEKEGAEAFIEAVQRPAAQKKVLEYGFRPGNPDVAVGAPITKGNGVDPTQPSKLLQVPQPSVMIDMLENWKQQRKGARVLLVLDVSGSMEEPADPDDPASDTKLDLAKRAAIDALDEFKGDDEVGLRVFSTDLGSREDENYLDLLEIQPMSTNRERLASQIRDQLPQHATPLYEVTQDSFEDMADGYDPSLINAVVLLTDGVNDDGDTSDDRDQLDELLTTLQSGTNGENATPIRVFTIAYGKQADFDTLERIAESTNAAAYDASNPATISQVFTAVVSNF
ncbi:MAG TPA: substrate-binding domain-containing protein [Acidimicrobiales bacterium]|nr:substrate-binding domain-containing protein [Acidimicrobiales bacterium]